MDKQRFSLRAALSRKILPAVTFHSAADVLPVAEAFLGAGLNLMEIPFRTPVAEEAIEMIRKAFPQMNVGAGTILSKGQLQDAINAGAQFGLAPGFSKTVCEEATRMEFPFIPGTMTPSEMEAAYEMGFNIQKWFPAEPLGGVAFLKAMQGPYQGLGIQFIPMGGVNPGNLKSYTSLSNVIAVGGSWLAPGECMAKKDYKQIELNVLAALKIVETAS